MPSKSRTTGLFLALIGPSKPEPKCPSPPKSKEKRVRSVVCLGRFSSLFQALSRHVAAFLQNEAVVWMTGGFLLLAGLVTIAHHQYWSSVAAVLISLFGWLLVLEGLILLIAPALNAYAAADLVASTTFIRALFSLLALAGLWLTYVGWIAKFISPDSSNVGKQHR